MMKMDSICLFFYQSSEVHLLLEKWHIHTTAPYLAALIATIVLGILIELSVFGISFIKHQIEKDSLTDKLSYNLINRSNEILDSGEQNQQEMMVEYRIQWI